MNSNVELQEAQGGYGVSILGVFHIGQSGFNPRIASLDAIADLTLSQAWRCWCPFQAELSYKTVASYMYYKKKKCDKT